MFIVMISTHTKSLEDINTKLGIVSTGRKRLDKNYSLWSYEVHVDKTNAPLRVYIAELQTLFAGKEDILKSFYEEGDKLNILWLTSKTKGNISFSINRDITSFLYNFSFNLQISPPNYDN